MAKNEKTCFVIMRFAAPYEERCERIYKPAIEAAELVPHLAGGPGTDKITLEIEEGIRNAHICLADISEDNLNVWYELGFAYACNKQVVAVSDKGKRSASDLPFDIKDKKVIFYDSIVDSNQHACKGFQAEITESAKVKAAKVVAASAVASSQGSAGEKLPAGWNETDTKVFKEIVNRFNKHYALTKLWDSDGKGLLDIADNSVLVKNSIEKMEKWWLLITLVQENGDGGESGYAPTGAGLEFASKHPYLFD